MRVILYSIVITFVYLTAAARPVSHKDGWTIMLNADRARQSFLLHYSPSAKYSVGYRFERNSDRQINFSFFQLNNLLYRLNKKNSQSNLYLKSGLGVANSTASSPIDSASLSFFSGLAFDWETRQYFFSYENRYLKSPRLIEAFSHSLRIGFAPYVANYGQFHTWIMLELDHDENSLHTTTISPLLRFFKGVNLVEIGISNYGDVQFSWISRLT